MDELAARMRALEDREAIRDLISRYGPLADSGDADGVASLWAPDGTYAVGGMGEAIGAAAVGDLISGPVHRDLMAAGCAHILSPPVIELNGDAASARCYSVVFRHDDAAWIAMRVSANRWRLVRDGERWLVLRRENVLLDGQVSARELLCPPSNVNWPPAA